MRIFVKRVAVVCAVFIIFGLAFAGISRAEIDPGTIVGLWLFDEGDGDVVEDTSGNGNDGEIFGPVWTTGKFGSALDFDGTDIYVEVPDDPSLAPMDEITIAVLVYLRTANATNVYNGILDKTAGATDRSYNIGLRDGLWEFGLANDANTKVTLNAGNVKTEEWVHIAGVYDGSEIELYENGVLLGSIAQSGSVNESNTVLWFSGWPGGADRGLDGMIDEAVIFSVALSEDDISTLVSQSIEMALAVDHIGKLAAAWGTLKTGPKE